MTIEPGNAATVVRLLVQKFPHHEMQMHRRYRRDEEFRLLCDDHLAAVQALEHWRVVEGAHAVRTEEYRLLVEELKSQILDTLECGSSP